MRLRTTVLTAGCAASLLALGACSGDGRTDDPTVTTGPSTVTAAPRTSQPAGAIAALSKVSCEFTDGAWSFKATLKNPDKERTTFTVMVAVAKTEGGTVVGSKTFTETLDPGQSKELAAAKFVKGKEKGNTCVPSATKAPAKS
ncbi:hypothetical protein [Knoellia koreensis]|uniref:Lipoprotein n=1 Tax=Knoellia koreensis TaxID=2730921 RepID=A0A849HTP0_9MICO|nr:hypothetical protein [Knoellia sp. DB2414S]NNM47957.1 hypothetical protein [Knoellia sp. DB2414S]